MLPSRESNVAVRPLLSESEKGSASLACVTVVFLILIVVFFPPVPLFRIAFIMLSVSQYFLLRVSSAAGFLFLVLDFLRMAF